MDRIFIVMGESVDNRFNIEELMEYLKSIDNGGFKKLTLTYIPGLMQFMFEPEFDTNDYSASYSRFVDELLKSKFSEFFNY
ncbi:hypothetical protein [Chryseobacterium sediminis]|uniref:Uncharacterized protein n=1 Tax=Chryseobacterium sediminis TaxID=1679494 RepID=A0A5B2U8H7_9FLAO|nr:hypothetical protein [Chryseobacterium sediminis]KAA2222829.1 hypothetical protein FW780_01110 [Chryseobacterium sediminis]